MPAKNNDPQNATEAMRLLAETLRAGSLRPNMHSYTPHDKQIKFHNSRKKRRLYIGGNRSGKTTGGIVEDLWWATDTHPYLDTPEPPIRGRIVGTDFLNGISKTVLPEISRWVPVTALRGQSWTTAYDKLERVLNFDNGSFIEFMSYDQDLDKFAGTSRHFIHFDEEPPKDIYNENMARLIDTGGSAWLTMTPVDGMTWVFDTLYLPGKEGSNVIDVIEVEMSENPHLAQAEVEEFLSSLDADEREARGKGKFVQLGGLIFKGFSRDRNVVERFNVLDHPDWLLAASLDHGFNAPTCWLWHAVSPDGQVVTFKEHYRNGLTIDEHARIVHAINKEIGRVPEFYIGDPSIRNTDPITGTSIHEEYIKYGVPLILGNNDVRAGIVKMARYLKPNAADKPNWLISVDCPRLIWEFGRYRWKTYASSKLSRDNNVQEAPHKKDDHALDSARYFIMSRPDLSPTGLSNSVEHLSNFIGAGTPLIGSDGLIRAGDHNQRRGYGDFNEMPQTQWDVDPDMGGIY